MKNDQYTLSDKRLRIHRQLSDVAECDPEQFEQLRLIIEALLRGDEKIKAAIMAEVEAVRKANQD